MVAGSFKHGRASVRGGQDDARGGVLRARSNDGRDDHCGRWACCPTSLCRPQHDGGRAANVVRRERARPASGDVRHGPCVDFRCRHDDDERWLARGCVGARRDRSARATHGGCQPCGLPASCRCRSCGRRLCRWATMQGGAAGRGRTACPMGYAGTGHATATADDAPCRGDRPKNARFRGVPSASQRDRGSFRTWRGVRRRRACRRDFCRTSSPLLPCACAWLREHLHEHAGCWLREHHRGRAGCWRRGCARAHDRGLADRDRQRLPRPPASVATPALQEINAS